MQTHVVFCAKEVKFTILLPTAMNDGAFSFELLQSPEDNIKNSTVADVKAHDRQSILNHFSLTLFLTVAK